MIVSTRRNGNGFGQPDPAVIAASVTPATVNLRGYFFMAVAAGVTVWLVTRLLDRQFKGGRRT